MNKTYTFLIKKLCILVVCSLLVHDASYALTTEGTQEAVSAASTALEVADQIQSVGSSSAYGQNVQQLLANRTGKDKLVKFFGDSFDVDLNSNFEIDPLREQMTIKVLDDGRSVMDTQTGEILPGRLTTPHKAGDKITLVDNELKNAKRRDYNLRRGNTPNPQPGPGPNPQPGPGPNPQPGPGPNPQPGPGPNPQPDPGPNPQPDPDPVDPKNKGTSTMGKVMAGLAVVGGGIGLYDANAGDEARTFGDLLQAAGSGAAVGAGIATLIPIPGVSQIVGGVIGGVVGAATVGFQMFSETDCLTDPVTNKQTCCNTTTGNVIVPIGGYMFCGKDGKVAAAVRQCQVGGKGKGSGWWSDLWEDDAWSAECMPRWCDGYSEPPTGLEKYIVPVPDTNNVCWKWECGPGFTLTQNKTKCLPKFCDGAGPVDPEAPLYVFTADTEKQCFNWDCVQPLVKSGRQCVDAQGGTPQVPAATRKTMEDSMYDSVIAKIQALIQEMEEECGPAAIAADNQTLQSAKSSTKQQNKKQATKK